MLKRYNEYHRNVQLHTEPPANNYFLCQYVLRPGLILRVLFPFQLVKLMCWQPKRCHRCYTTSHRPDLSGYFYLMSGYFSSGLMNPLTPHSLTLNY